MRSTALRMTSIGQGLPAINAGAQRRKVEFSKLGVVHLGDKHRRHAVDRCTAFLCDRLESGEWVKSFARIDHCRPVSQATEITDHHTKAVVQRDWYADPVVLGEFHCPGDKQTVV